jgi:hypothetical protein
MERYVESMRMGERDLKTYVSGYQIKFNMHYWMKILEMIILLSF